MIFHEFIATQLWADINEVDIDEPGLREKSVQCDHPDILMSDAVREEMCSETVPVDIVTFRQFPRLMKTSEARCIQGIRRVVPPWKITHLESGLSCAFS